MASPEPKAEAKAEPKVEPKTGTTDLAPLAVAAFQGAAANVGPLVGHDLQSGEVTIETSSARPTGDLAVLPLALSVDDNEIARGAIYSPLTEIVLLGRRMLDDAEPDKPREITDEEYDAIGEVLNLMSGAVDQAVRQHLNDTLRTRPLQWWRTTDSGDHRFDEGEFTIAKGSVVIPSGAAITIFLRIPQRALRDGADAESQRCRGRVMLLALEEDIANLIQPVLETINIDVARHQPDEAHIDEQYMRAHAVFMSGDRDGTLDLCRRLRMSDVTWELPVVVCFKTPTRDVVLRALECGASQVLGVPADDTTLLRVLNQVRREGD